MFFIILATCAFAASDNEAGQLSDAEVQQQKAQALLSRMKESRDLLRSGSYRASGRVSTNRRTSGTGRLQGPIEIFSAFDFDKQLCRFDQTEPVIRKLSEGSVAGEETGKYIRTQDLACSCILPWADSGRLVVPAGAVRYIIYRKQLPTTPERRTSTAPRAKRTG
jgi:hypothetical protein